MLCQNAVLLSVLSVSVMLTIDPSSAFSQTLHTADKAIADVVLSGMADEETLTFTPKRLGKKGERPGTSVTRIPADAVVSWGAWQPAASTATVWLADGSWLVGAVTFSDSTVSVTPSWAEAVSVEFPQVGGVILDPPRNPNQLYGLIQEMMTSSGSRDLVWLKSGQKISGLLRLKRRPESDYAFTLAGGDKSVDLAREEVRAFVFSPDLVSAPNISQLDRAVGLKDGSLLHLRDLTSGLHAMLGPRAKPVLSTLGGVGLSPLGRPELGELAPSVAVTYIGGDPSKVALLSLAEPLTYKFSDASLLQWPLGKNTDIHQSLLREGRRVLPRGLAMHASSQVAFRVPEGSQRFIAEVTLSGELPHRSDSRRVDESDPSVGSVTCEVVVARAGKLETLASVQLSVSQERSAILDVACPESSLVVLVVRESNLGNYGDQVRWTAARLVK